MGIKLKRAVAKRPSIKSEYVRIFSENEKRSKHWTDVEIREQLLKLFPEKKGKSTILRVSMFRACYNKGTGPFAKDGKGRPNSTCYGSAPKELDRKPKAKVTTKKVAKKTNKPKTKATEKIIDA